MTSANLNKGWCLIMAMWGDRYHVGYPNQIASGVADNSPDCTDMLLITDRVHNGLHPRIRQIMIPESFMKPEFFKGGYPVKLSIFLTPGVAPDTRCIFVDLDTVILGDLSRLAERVRSPDDVLMLPPSMLGFNPISRLAYKLTKGKHFRTGNSSLVAFTSSASPNLAETFLARHADPETRDDAFMAIDDRFISWFAQPTLRGVPTSIAVMLRREFLSRIPGVVAWRSRSASRRQKRQALAAVTLNGVSAKPETLLKLKTGAVLEDGKGRSGFWGPQGFAPVFDRFRDRVTSIANGAEGHDQQSPRVGKAGPSGS